MRKTILTSVLVLSLGLFVTSCKENKKSEVETKEEVIEVVEKTENMAVDSTEVAEGDEMAMAEFQCPMKCEGDKTYKEAGSCPVCKMDLKKVEKEEENHDGHDHD